MEGEEDNNYNYKLSGSGQTKSGLELINELKPWKLSPSEGNCGLMVMVRWRQTLRRQAGCYMKWYCYCLTGVEVGVGESGRRPSRLWLWWEAGAGGTGYGPCGDNGASWWSATQAGPARIFLSQQTWHNQRIIFSRPLLFSLDQTALIDVFKVNVFLLIMKTDAGVIRNVVRITIDNYYWPSSSC